MGAQCLPCRAHHLSQYRERGSDGWSQFTNHIGRWLRLVVAFVAAVVHADENIQAYHHYRASCGRSVFACRAHHFLDMRA